MAYSAPLLKELLDRRRPGYSLEAPFYLSEDVCRADLDLIFGRHWIFVGVAPQVPEEGDYFTVEIGTQSIVVVRDDDREIRAFHNVCRHRGSRLCGARQGSVGNLVCPYHQWTYDLSGKLIHAENMGVDFDRGAHGLRSVALRNLEGLLYICLADEPPDDFDEVARLMRPYLAPHRPQDCKVALQTDTLEKANWKLTMENNRECYHCMVNHPELSRSMFEQGFGYQSGPQNAAGVARFEKIVAETCALWEGMGLPSRELEQLDGRATGYRTQRLPLDRSGESQTMDGKVASRKLLADFTDPALGGLSFWTQPNSWHHFMSDHIVTFAALPVSAGLTLVRTTWLVHRDAVEGVDYDPKNLSHVWNATNHQDSRLVEECQIGIASGAYRPGPYSPYAEGLVDKFTHWYVQRMQAGLARR